MSSSARGFTAPIYRGIATLMLLASALPAARAAPPILPPISEPASSEHHLGKPIWLELVTPDLAVAERFYGTVFGWTFRSLPAGHVEYAIAMLGSRPVAGLVQRAADSGEHRQSAWLTFLAAADVNAAAGSALAHGAKIIAPARSVPARGRHAVLSDPQGAVFAVLASQSGDPPDYLAAPGEWIWSSLQTSDPGADAAFYQAVFNYEVFDLPSDDSREHLILSSDGYARASINGLPSDSAHQHPHWLNFVRVLDAGDAAARVQTAGGRVLVDPHADRHGGRIAVVADPAGAPFGLLEWSSGESHEEPK